MEKPKKLFIFILMLFTFPALFWLMALKKFQGIPKQHTFSYLNYAIHETFKFSDYRLIIALLLGLITAVILGFLFGLFSENYFKGRVFKKHLRGTKIVSPRELTSITSERGKEQVRIANIPIPTKLESLHFLLNGGTGTGKTVVISQLLHDVLQRSKTEGDRVIIVDPNGELFSKFGRKGDVLLNPFDSRTTGWNVFNEIKNDFDYDKICQSIVPTGKDANSEEWNAYGRLLLKDSMKIQKLTGNRATMKEVQQLATQASVKDLKAKLTGMDSQSLFVEGADKALGSARFTLSNRLPAYNLMPDGDFSIRDFLKDGQTGNIFITWREDQTTALRPLISAWCDIICNTILSLPPSRTRKIWLSLDELSTLDVLSSLSDALEKGRKHGLRVIAGLQTVSQLVEIYGKNKALILMANLRNLIVLGGSKTDSETSEAMSKSLGEHEVVREQISKNTSMGLGNSSKNVSETVVREPVVMASEISSLPDLTGYLSFASDHPITRIKLKIADYPVINQPYKERVIFND